LHGGDTEDVIQLAVYLVHPIDGGCGQGVQECYRRSYVLTGTSEGRAWRPLSIDGRGYGLGPSLGFGEVDHYGRPILSANLRWCCSISEASMAAHSPVSSPCHWVALCSASTCRARSVVPGLCVAVRSWTISMVRNTGVFSSSGVVMMGTVGVTMLHPRGSGNPELPPLPEAVLPLSEVSSRTVCKDSDPLCTISMNTAPESSP
jgi:hypothetical protein